jgi:hypothetical protein
MKHAGVPTVPVLVLAIPRTSLSIARIRAPIPKHDCAIVGVPLGFRYGHSKEHETRGDCR